MTTLRHLRPTPAITKPAIWGRLALHADHVRSGMRPGEGEGWKHWLSMQGPAVREGGPILPSTTLPTAFVLPPGALSFAPRRFVVGVIVPSMDLAGRRHALVAYQLARPRWVQRHFAFHARYPQNWLFWLGRALSRCTALAEVADIWTLAPVVEELWGMHASADAWWRRGTGLLPGTDRIEALLERSLGLSPASDPAAHMMGVRHLPWADWPQCFLDRPADMQPAFWQQDINGRFVNAARRLDRLWSESP